MPPLTEVKIGVVGRVGKSTVESMMSGILAAEGSNAEAMASGNRKATVVLSDAQAGQERKWRQIAAEQGERDVIAVTADESIIAMDARDVLGKVVSFGLTSSADFRADDLIATTAGTTFKLHHAGAQHPVSLQILGEHHVLNALAAIAITHALGVPLERAISALGALRSIGKWTMETAIGNGGALVINDSVSANWESTSAALKTLALITPAENRSVAVLGELDCSPEDSRDEHDRIGRLIVRLNIKQLFVVGHDARHIHNAAALEGSWDGESVLVDTPAEAYDLLDGKLHEGDVVLVKSSATTNLGPLGERLSGVLS